MSHCHFKGWSYRNGVGHIGGHIDQNAKKPINKGLVILVILVISIKLLAFAGRSLHHFPTGGWRGCSSYYFTTDFKNQYDQYDQYDQARFGGLLRGHIEKDQYDQYGHAAIGGIICRFRTIVLDR